MKFKKKAIAILGAVVSILATAATGLLNPEDVTTPEQSAGQVNEVNPKIENVEATGATVEGVELEGAKVEGVEATATGVEGGIHINNYPAENNSPAPTNEITQQNISGFANNYANFNVGNASRISQQPKAEQRESSLSLEPRVPQGGIKSTSFDNQKFAQSVNQSIGDNSDGNVQSVGENNEITVENNTEEKKIELNGGQYSEDGVIENNTDCTGNGGITACGSGATFNFDSSDQQN